MEEVPMCKCGHTSMCSLPGCWHPRANNFYDRLAAALHVSRDYAKKTFYEIGYGLEKDPWLVYLFNQTSRFLAIDVARTSRR